MRRGATEARFCATLRETVFYATLSSIRVEVSSRKGYSIGKTQYPT